MSDLARILTNLNSRIDMLERQLSRQPFGLPGFKQPFVGVAGQQAGSGIAVGIPIAAGDLSEQMGVFNVSPSGPFVLTGMAAFWLATIDDSPLERRFQPISSVLDLANPPANNALNFTYELEIAGTEWHLQNGPIPSPFLFSNRDRPRYQQTEYLLTGNDAISVKITPTGAPPVAGVLFFCFLGYKILSTDLLGGKGYDQPSLEQLPGLRLPYTARIDVTVAKGLTDDLFGSFTMGSDGLFCVEALGAAFTCDTAVPVGRYRPISSLQSSTLALPVVESPDFLWSCTSGTDLAWQGPGGTPIIPGPLLFTNVERPLYLAAPLQIPPGTQVAWNVKPLQTFEGGALTLILDGYIIVQGESWRGV